MHSLKTHQPVGIWPFVSAVDYSAENKKMSDIAWAINKSEFPPEIPISQAEELIATTTRAVDRFVADAQSVIKNSPGVRDQLRFQVRAVQHDYTEKIGRLRTIINTAKSQGKTTVPSFRFNHRDIPLMLLSVVAGYEAVQFIDEAKPFLVRSMPFVVSIFVTVGRVVEKIIGIAKSLISGLKAGVDAAASGTEMLISILKWGSVAGGLFLLYRALEPKKTKP